MTNIQVAVRIRPLCGKEIHSANVIPIVTLESKHVVAVTNLKVPIHKAGDSRERVRLFTFDFCFDQDSTQTQVFQALGRDVLQSVSAKYNVCVLAYGQSATGKTYTMTGNKEDPGLIPRICQGLFELFEEDNQFEKQLKVSFLEIYNEKVQDLLNPKGKNAQILKIREHPKHGPYVQEIYNEKVQDLLNPKGKNAQILKIREHPKHGPYVQGLSEHDVEDVDALLDCIHKGEEVRSVAATLSNKSSSRSHSLLTLTCRQLKDGIETSNKIHLVDLAGSERASSASNSLCRLKEGANINRSLVALGNVITALAENTGGRPTHRFIPYRDSVLTWLLKDTLGGNSNTIMIATVSPSNICYNETINTLRFGQQAKQIVNEPIINENPTSRLIRELRAEISHLRELLKHQQINMEKAPQKVLQPSNSSIARNKQPLLSKSQSSTKEAPLNNKSKSHSLLTKKNNLRRALSVTELTSKKPIIPRSISQEVLTRSLTLDFQYPGARKMKNKGYSNEILEEQFSNKEIMNPTMITQETQTSITGDINEEKSLKLSIKDAIKKHDANKRSEIVASVTERLYAKAKRKNEIKEFEPRTRSSSSSLTSELSICTNARNRLQEISLRALNASRRKRSTASAETQTDFISTIRVKEIATDVPYDMNEILNLTKDVSIETNADVNDIAVGPNIPLTSEKITETQEIALKLTRSCGNTTDNCNDLSKPFPPKNKLLSFTKYITHNTPSVDQSRISFSIPSFDPEIYTTSVNINFNLSNSNLEDSISDDSLDNVCISRTPDLLSNHNSLENNLHLNSNQNPLQSTPIVLVQKIFHAIEYCNVEFFEIAVERSYHLDYNLCKAQVRYQEIINCVAVVTQIETLQVDYCTAEINYNNETFNEQVKPMIQQKFCSLIRKPIITNILDFPINCECQYSDTDISSLKNDLYRLDTCLYKADLEKFLIKEKYEPIENVTWYDADDFKTSPNIKLSEDFNSKSYNHSVSLNKNMIESVTEFLDEASSIISNMKSFTQKIISCPKCALLECNCKKINKTLISMPINRWEHKLEKSCNRLEKCINFSESDTFSSDRKYRSGYFVNLRKEPRKQIYPYSPRFYLQQLQKARSKVIEESRQSLQRLREF